MSYDEPAGTAGRRTRLTVLAALVAVGAVLLGVLGYPSSVASSLATASPLAVPPPVHRPYERLHDDQRGPLGRADGVVPDGVTVFDDRYPAVARLDPALLGALRRAATAAARDGLTLYVNSGWRSRAYQEQLFREAVTTYGSAARAARWVASPGTSAHESGDAVDLGPSGATSWLARHGSAYGLCPIYRNEAWHFELRPQAVAHGCPRRYADPTHDPRLQQ